MMRKLFYIIFVFLLMPATYSCDENYTKTKTYNILLKYKWKMINIVDYTNNTTTDLDSVNFYFEEQNVFYKVYDNGDTVFSSWKLFPDGVNITIASNTYKITEITKNVLSLRYGNVEFFFKSYKK